MVFLLHGEMAKISVEHFQRRYRRGGSALDGVWALLYFTGLPWGAFLFWSVGLLIYRKRDFFCRSENDSQLLDARLAAAPYVIGFRRSLFSLTLFPEVIFSALSLEILRTRVGFLLDVLVFADRTLCVQGHGDALLAN